MSEKVNNIFYNLMNNIALKKIIFLLLLVLFFVYIYDLNILYPLFADDWDYSYVYWHPERITNVFQVFYSQAIHYVKWGGRSVLHGILQTLLMLGSTWADFLNSLVFIFYIWIIYKIANFGNRIKPSLLILIFFSIWFLQVNIGETILWLSGSANYLWGTSIILAFVYFYYKYFIESLLNKRSIFWKTKGNSIAYCMMFFFLGIIAGWTNENMAIALIFIIICFIVIVYKKNKKIEKWTLFGFTGAIMGALIMYLAPGNMVRYNLRLKALGISNPPPKSFYYDNISTWFNLVLDNLTVLVIFMVAIFIIFIIFSKNPQKRIILLSASLFLVSAVLATLALVAAPEFSDRMFFGVITLIIISISLIYSNLNFHNIYFSSIVFTAFIFTLVYFFNTYKEGRSYLVQINHIVEDRVEQINQQKAVGKKNIVLYTKRFDYRDDLIIPKMIDLPVSDDSTLWMNQAYCRYYGIKSKKITEP